VIVADEGLKLMLITNQDPKTLKRKPEEASEAPDRLMNTTVHKE